MAGLSNGPSWTAPSRRSSRRTSHSAAAAGTGATAAPRARPTRLAVACWAGRGEEGAVPATRSATARAKQQRSLAGVVTRTTAAVLRTYISNLARSLGTRLSLGVRLQKSWCAPRDVITLRMGELPRAHKARPHAPLDTYLLLDPVFWRHVRRTAARFAVAAAARPCGGGELGRFRR